MNFFILFPIKRVNVSIQKYYAVKYIEKVFGHQLYVCVCEMYGYLLTTMQLMIQEPFQMMTMNFSIKSILAQSAFVQNNTRTSS